jgi:hypothetical protein
LLGCQQGIKPERRITAIKQNQIARARLFQMRRDTRTLGGR